MQEYRKTKLIMTELLDYAYQHGMSEAHIQIQMLDHINIITLEFNIKEQPNDIEKTFKQLNGRRRPEVEDYYEDLLGLNAGQQNIDIIAAMIDEAEYQLVDNQLKMVIKRIPS